jgi:hypothetical protein
MKKFSNITNVKVGQEPDKKENKMNEEESFRFALLGLIDKHLHIQTYGPIDRYLRAGTIKITGKEALAGAIAELMTDKTTLEKTALLESLKGKVGNWEAIDEKIEEVGSEWSKKVQDRLLAPHVRKIEQLMEKYGEDEDMLVEMAKKSAGKMRTYNNASLRAAAAATMKLEKIAGIYVERANKLFEEK